jgi:Ni,Fe-hydrogenase I cytochrome b subunit
MTDNGQVNVRFRHRLTVIALALMVVVAVVAAVRR